MPRLFRASIFRIALVYLALMGATVGGIVAIVYWSTAGLIERQTSETVEAEIRGLAEQYDQDGLARLVEVIAERSGAGGDPQNVYVLASPALVALAGNLGTWPDRDPGADGWIEVPLERRDDVRRKRHIVRGRAFMLAGGYRLFVGRNAVGQEDFRDIVFDALAWALGPALLFGLLGGVVIARYSLSRVDSVRATSDEIVAGDLTRRVPLNGSGDEFDRLAQTVNHMLDRIETLMTGMRTVTDSLAHDLRSPLTRAKSGIDLALRRQSDGEAYRQALEQTNGELDNILHTFESLLRIAHVEANASGVALETLDLSTLAADLAEMFQPLAEDGGLALSADIAPDVSIAGHRQLLGQAVTNLLENALKFTPVGGQMTMGLARQGGRAVLTVADSGPGIPEADRERVLQRFVRLDESRNRPGSGLGLSLVAAVANLHCATLDLGDNEPGLKVTLTFPLSV